ncbi:Sec-independent protein translocase protein TatB [Psychrobacter ciconiae]|uniref:Sec-independent protein translocase protein TatB n=1 Tax=Psychrobacter ciconiae TaxID=1553449 RepID=UPI00191AD3E5|nr:Sec-independent protein translocase protein TatB [Psychrobacter ciconiae]
MFDIGFSELLIFGIVALVVLGPEKLPKAARTAGQWYGKLRRTVSTLQSEIEAELDLAETRQQLKDELAKIRQTEAEMRSEMARMRGSIHEMEAASRQHQSQNQTTAPQFADNNKGGGKHAAPTADYSYHQGSQPTSSAPDNDHQSNLKADIAEADDWLATKPWENMWFKLGDYDKARRLPPAPRLPNYQADMLLSAQRLTQSSSGDK